MRRNYISIIIPYFKKKEFFSDCFNSVYNQTYRKKEIIIVYDDNDLSDVDYIKKIIKNKKNTFLFINKKNKGVGQSRNFAIKKSKGEFLAFIDSDDLWNKKKLEIQIKFMKNKNILASFTSYSVINSFGKTIGFREANKVITLKDLRYSCDIGLSTVVIKRTKKINNIIRFPDLKTKEDYVLWINLTKKNVNFFGIKRNLTSWRKLNNSLSSNLVQKLIDGYRVYNRHFKYNFLKSIFHLILLSLNYLKKTILN